MEYKESGKIDWNKSTLYLILGILAGCVLGAVYGLITAFNPIIYINFLLLIGLWVCMGIVFKFCVTSTFNRNPMIRVVFLSIIVLFTWYVNWVAFLAVKGVPFWDSLINIQDTLNNIAYYSENVNLSISSRGGRGTSVGHVMPIAHIIELGVFCYFVYAAFEEKVYYCEDCDEPMLSFTMDENLLDDTSKENLTDNFEKFVENRLTPKTEEEKLDDLLYLTNGIHRFLVNYCPKCGKTVVTLMKVVYTFEGDKVKNTKETIIHKNILLDKPFTTLGRL